MDVEVRHEDALLRIPSEKPESCRDMCEDSILGEGGVGWGIGYFCAEDGWGIGLVVGLCRGASSWESSMWPCAEWKVAVSDVILD